MPTHEPKDTDALIKEAPLQEGAAAVDLPPWSLEPRVVFAARIKAVSMNFAGSVMSDAQLVFDGGFRPITKSAEWISAHNPTIGEYYVYEGSGMDRTLPAHIFELWHKDDRLR